MHIAKAEGLTCDPVLMVRRVREIGAQPGDLLKITSTHGYVLTVAEADDTVHPESITLAHCYGDLPGSDDDPLAVGANPGRLLTLGSDHEDINAMPRMMGLPVTVRVHTSAHVA